MPKIKLNGKDVEIPAGKSLLQGCLDSGAYVPHYCYHPGLTPAGNCRMCLVKVSNSRKLEASCMYPATDGLEVTRRLRLAGDDVSILMLTARDEVRDRVAGLETGADDYLVKPFSFEELLARVHALLRRMPSQGGEVLGFADLSLDVDAREARRAGRSIVKVSGCGGRSGGSCPNGKSATPSRPTTRRRAEKSGSLPTRRPTLSGTPESASCCKSTGWTR